jgi:hypothetical protein
MASFTDEMQIHLPDARQESVGIVRWVFGAVVVGHDAVIRSLLRGQFDRPDSTVCVLKGEDLAIDYDGDAISEWAEDPDRCRAVVRMSTQD